MAVLREMELRDDGRGNGVFFSIKYVQGNGELVYFAPTRRRGVMPVDAAGNDIAPHPYPVGIDNILEFNGERVDF